MRGWIRWMSTVGVAGVVLSSLGCGKQGGDGGGSGSVYSVLKKKSGTSGAPLIRALRQALAAQPITLTNVSGMADSLLVNHDGQDYCSFSAWSANSQEGPVAVAGRTLEAFDLGNPKNWTSVGTGIRDGCTGGKIIEAEAYFAYVDLSLTTAASSLPGEQVVRIALGETGVYKFGDVLVKSGGVFNWIDSATSALTPDSSPRPSNPHRYPALAAMTVPYQDGGRTVVMTKVRMRVDDATKNETVSKDTSKVVFEVDFASIELGADDQSSAAALAKSLTVPFLDAIQGDPSKFLLARVTPLAETEVGSADDPAPTLGNPPAEKQP